MTEGRLTEQEGAGLLIQGPQETGEQVRLLHLPPIEVLDKYEVNGYPVYACRGKRWLDPRKLRGEVVLLGGEFYKIIGVETFATLDALGDDFGLMVKPYIAGEEPEELLSTIIKPH